MYAVRGMNEAEEVQAAIPSHRLEEARLSWVKCYLHKLICGDMQGSEPSTPTGVAPTTQAATRLESSAEVVPRTGSREALFVINYYSDNVLDSVGDVDMNIDLNGFDFGKMLDDGSEMDVDTVFCKDGGDPRRVDPEADFVDPETDDFQVLVLDQAASNKRRHSGGARQGEAPAEAKRGKSSTV